MYGFSPARFVPRRTEDHQVYETLEIQWMLAFFDKYREMVGDGAVYDLTQQGISTGTLMVSDEWAERDNVRWVHHLVSAQMARELREDIDREIMAKIIGEVRNAHLDAALTLPAVQTMETALYGSELTRERLIAHDRYLDMKNPQTAVEAHLRALGIKV